MKKYIVCWVIQKTPDSEISNEGGIIYTDHYQVFIDGETSIENKKEAEKLYNELINKEPVEENGWTDKVWSANLCEIVESTDYFD